MYIYMQIYIYIFLMKYYYTKDWKFSPSVAIQINTNFEIFCLKIRNIMWAFVNFV